MGSDIKYQICQRNIIVFIYMHFSEDGFEKSGVCIILIEYKLRYSQLQMSHF